ncbi:hypothetical protein MUO98_02775 [Candidatus Bathyarchaeota archaeon]|nr:hypothetical protein [Candidatus Bathyarchaeota archaeon]
MLDSEVFWEGSKGYFVIRTAELQPKR